MFSARLKAYILLFLVAVIWGIAGPVIKLTLNGLTPELFLLYRYFISTIAAIIIIKIAKLHFPRDLRKLGLIILYGLLNSTFALWSLFAGLSKTSLLNSSLITLLGPILVIFIGYIFLKDHVTKREKLGIFIAVIGSVILTLGPILKIDHGESQFVGNLLVAGYVVFTSIAVFIAKKLMRNGISPIFLTNVSFIIGFITMIPIALLNNSLFDIWHLAFDLSPAYHAGVWYMALISGTLAFTLNNMGQKTIEVSEAALFSYLYPIFSAILAVLVLGDKLTPAIIIGGAITFLGVAIAEIKKKRYN